MKGLITIACFLIFAETQLFSQCAPGPFSVDPASATTLECMAPPTTSNLCEALGFQTQITVPAGMQVCFIANGIDGEANFNFVTCDTNTDETSISLFDAFGNAFDDSGSCDVGFSEPAGTIVCIQVESVTNGICDGTNSESPSYILDIQCDRSPDEFVPDFEEADLCQVVGFNDLQTVIFEDDVDNFISFEFDTGVTGQTADYTTGSLTICAQANLGGDEEFWKIDDENGICIGGIGNTGISCPDTPVCTSFNFDAAQVAAMVADGVVTFNLENLDGEIGAFCDINLLSLELNLCAQPSVIPTMGEWGLISLGLLLLSFNVIAIRQKQFVLN
jgi:hypothetical protein